jgi:hypothetical protein
VPRRRAKPLGRITKSEAERLAAAFRTGRDQTQSPEVQAMIQAAVQRIHADFARLPVRVEWTKRDPYATFEEMRDQVRSTGVLYIWTGASDVPMWDPETNWKARAIHDWDHISAAFDFTMDGEYQGFRVAAAKIPQLAPLYLSEIALQAAVSVTTSDFAEQQKIVLLNAEELRWAEGLGAYGDQDVGIATWAAVLVTTTSPEEAAMYLGALGYTQRQALQIVEAANIYNALVEGQME